MHYAYQKTQNMMLTSNLQKKFAKNSCEKIYHRKSDRKREFLIFINEYKS
jgi:hypothetical protein